MFLLLSILSYGKCDYFDSSKKKLEWNETLLCTWSVGIGLNAWKKCDICWKNIAVCSCMRTTWILSRFSCRLLCALQCACLRLHSNIERTERKKQIKIYKEERTLILHSYWTYRSQNGETKLIPFIIPYTNKESACKANEWILKIKNTWLKSFFSIK